MNRRNFDLLQEVASPWRNRLARLTVNQEVGSSSLPGDEFLFFFFFSTQTKPPFLFSSISILDSISPGSPFCIPNDSFSVPHLET